MSAFLFNLSAVPRENETSLYAEFYAGDILGCRSDALICSSFAGDYSPVPGTVLGDLRVRFGFDFAHGLPPGSSTYSGRLHHVRVPATAVFKTLWILDLKDWDGKPTLSAGQLKLAFDTLIRHADEVSADARSISLPLLGTGSMGLEVEPVVREILRLVKQWAICAPRVEIVRVFAHDFEKVALLNLAIEGVLDRATASSDTRLLEAVAEELSQKLESFSEPFRSSLRNLLSVARSASPSVGAVATEGRKFAELFAARMCACLNLAAGNTLNEAITVLQPHLAPRRAWVTSYLRLLQYLGNEAVHYKAGQFRLTHMDAAAVLVSAIRIAESAEEIRARK
ncbi:MAG TPA: hypothetical protein PLP42_08160 [Acidobacteriota bacterium]|nr:hypothetical protein [Acidobacteriota bacterium]